MAASINDVSTQLSHSDIKTVPTIYEKSLTHNAALLKGGYFQQYFYNDNFPNLHFHLKTTTLSSDEFLKQIQGIINVITTDMDENPLTKAVKEVLITHRNINVYFVKHQKTKAYWEPTNKIIGISDACQDPKVLIEIFTFELCNANNPLTNDPTTDMKFFENSIDFAEALEKAECHTEDATCELLFAIGITTRNKKDAEKQMEIAKTYFDESSQGYTHYNRCVYRHNEYKIEQNKSKLFKLNIAVGIIYFPTFVSKKLDKLYQEICQTRRQLILDLETRLAVRNSLQKEAAENLEKLPAQNEAFNKRLEELERTLKEQQLYQARELERLKQEILLVRNLNQLSSAYNSNISDLPQDNADQLKPNFNKARQE